MHQTKHAWFIPHCQQYMSMSDKNLRFLSSCVAVRKQLQAVIRVNYREYFIRLWNEWNTWSADLNV